MTRILVITLCLMVSAAGAEELAGLLMEYEVVQAARKGWKRADQTPEFRKMVIELQKKTAAYTRARSGEELDPATWGWKLVWPLYRDYLLLTLDTYEECEAAVRELWTLLEHAKTTHASECARLSLELVFDVIYDRAPTRPFECAKLWDEESERIAALDCARVNNLQRAHSSRVEGWLLKYSDNVREDEREAFFEERYRSLMKLLADENLRTFRRAKILSSWIVYRNAFGRWADASAAVENWWRKYGSDITEADYYLSRMWVAWYHEGNWEKASETLRRFSRLVEEGRAGPGYEQYRNMTDIYYTRIFSPGHELKRQHNSKIGIDKR